MRHMLIRVLTILLGVSVVAWVASLVISMKLNHGDERSDDFRVATIMNGGEFSSHASSLRSGVAITVMGGARIDLRGATLDPAGATLELNTFVGGLEVLVPEDWAVEVEDQAVGGDIKVNVASLEDLPEDAPRLRIHAVLRMGAAEITAKAM
jgi:predicted membrane protein